MQTQKAAVADHEKEAQSCALLQNTSSHNNENDDKDQSFVCSVVNIVAREDKNPEDEV